MSYKLLAIKNYLEGEIILLYLRSPNQNRFSFHLDSAAMLKFAETLVRILYRPPQHTPLTEQYLSKDMQNLYMKSESYCRLTF